MSIVSAFSPLHISAYFLIFHFYSLQPNSSIFIIMSELFEINRSHFLKIFETHQFKGLVSFTDILKICSSLKIFPDLIDSQDIQKTFATVSSGSFHKITYLEFEDFLKLIAKKLFASSDDKSDCIEIFLAHIKNFALKSYGTEIKTLIRRQRSLAKYLKGKKQLSSSVIKNKSVAKLPETTRNMGSRKQFFQMINPNLMKFKKKKEEKNNDAMTERKVEGTSFNNENFVGSKIAQVNSLVRKLRKKVRENKGEKALRTRKLGNCNRIAKMGRNRFLLLKMYFQVWKWAI